MQFIHKIRKLIKRFVYRFHFMQRCKLKSVLDLNDSCRFIYYDNNKLKQYVKLIDSINIDVKDNRRFLHWIDENLRMFHLESVIGNIPPDYNLVVNNSIDSLCHYNCELIDAIKRYIYRIIDKIDLCNCSEKSKYISYFKNMIDDRACSLEEALQRILFWSSLFWQTGHKLVGLGRLDLVLNRFSQMNTEDEQIAIIMDFLAELNDYYKFKSNNLLGDIGQIIIVGGKDLDDKYFCNSLTTSFIKAATNLKKSDPKILLRVSTGMPEELLNLAIECISTGIGSPLLSNDDVVIDSLIDFGYEKKDAYNYVTSACWEPVSYGNSLEQNNIANINFASVIVNTIKDNAFKNVSNFEELLSLYKGKLIIELKRVLSFIDLIIWEEDPLFSLFTDDCRESGVDIACGGAKYNDYGVLSMQ